MAKKKGEASPSEKVIGLYGLLLFTGRKYSLPELADKFQCSKQTVLRMVETVERSHTLHVISELENGIRWFWVDAPRRTSNASLTTKEIQYLNLCKDMVAGLLPLGIKEEIAHSIEVSSSLALDRAKPPRNTRPLGFISSNGAVEYADHQEQIDNLLFAIENKQVCIIKYAPPLKQPSEHHFAPDKIHIRGKALYAEGWKVTDRGAVEIECEQTLAIHRMINVTISRRTFDFGKRHRDISPYFGFGVSNPFKVKIHFHSYAPTYVRERRWSIDQVFTELDDGSIELEFTAQSEPEVIAMVLSFGSDAELISPESIRAQLAQTAHSLYEIYG